MSPGSADLLSIRSLVHAFRDFAECVVESVEWADHGATITIAMDYIWRADGTVRDDADDRRLVALTFGLVQEFRVANNLTAAVVADPTLLGWSANEVALLEIKSDEVARQYSTDTAQFCRATFWRESEAWIDVVFAHLTINEVGSP